MVGEFMEKTAKEKEKMWDARFIKLAREVGSWTSCIRRAVGAVIVKNNRILTTGYNGAPQGITSCKEREECLRNKLNIESGTRQEICYAIHAEQNAVVQAAKLGECIDGATIYVTHQPCSLCTRILINAGIKRIVYAEGYPDDFSLELLENAKIQLDKLDENN